MSATPTNATAPSTTTPAAHATEELSENCRARVCHGIEIDHDHDAPDYDPYPHLSVRRDGDGAELSFKYGPGATKTRIGREGLLAFHDALHVVLDGIFAPGEFDDIDAILGSREPVPPTGKEHHAPWEIALGAGENVALLSMPWAVTVDNEACGSFLKITTGPTEIEIELNPLTVEQLHDAVSAVLKKIEREPRKPRGQRRRTNPLGKQPKPRAPSPRASKPRGAEAVGSPQ
jgi:hypothetical protein